MNLVFKTNKLNKTTVAVVVDEIDDGYNEDNFEGGINLKHLFFSDPIQNSIIHDSYFIRVNYSDNDVSLIGLMLPIKLSFITILKSFNKNIIMYDLHSNKKVILNICQLETLILEKYKKYNNSTNNISKIPVYNLSNQLKSCSIKLFSDIDKRTQECNIMVKISGVWENIREYGITFKFMDSQS